MNDASKAVFLSYASQDAEAAKRIADALRGAGVEVWFDAEGGLEHGDEWDAKIRRQIKECVLFIAVISANTQAREEGYFRIEWELAAQRALGFASGVAFILPVVIDGTKESEALVPDRFRSVQWTKLPGGVVPPEVLQRFLRLWSHRTGALKHTHALTHLPETASVPQVQGPRENRHTWLGASVVGVLVLAAVAYFSLQSRHPSPPSTRDASPQPPAPTAAGPLTEAQKLVERMQAIYDSGDDAANDEWTLAEELGVRATALEPVNAEAWAVYSHVLSMPYIFGFDNTQERLARVTKAAERAMTLDPRSVAARLALANCRRLQGRVTLGEAETIMRQLVAEQPGSWQVQRMAGNIFRTAEKYPEALASFDRAAALSNNNPFTLHGKCRTYMVTGRFAEAEAILDQLIRRNASPIATVRKIAFQLYMHDDLDAAEAILGQVSPAYLAREEPADYASTLWLWRRNADRCVAALARFSGDTLVGQPKGLIAGVAYRAAQRESAARLEWQGALQKIDRKLALEPSDSDQLFWKAALLALLDRKAEAQKSLETCQQLNPLTNYRHGLLLMLLGRLEDAMGLLEASASETIAPFSSALRLGEFRHDPIYDPLRSNPRYAVMLAKMEAANPRLRREGEPALNGNAVAVLPFANLSGDKEQEYFSDGLTEEILNALARERDLRVPGRASSFSFKGRNVSAAEIARVLNVSRLIEGSVRKSGNRVRISVSLTRAADGFSEELGTFTEDLTDIFALQDKVARVVVEKLTQRSGRTVVVAHTKNADAYDLYLRGRALQTRAANFAPQAVPLYEQAVALDPSFALAWARLAEARFRAFGAQVDRSPELVEKTKVAIDRALAANPDLPEALIMRANWSRYVKNDLTAAQRDLERAESLQPPTAFLLMAQATLARERGDWPGAFQLCRRALALDPENGDYTVAASAGFFSIRGEFLEADRLYARAMIIQGPGAPTPFGNRVSLRQEWRGSEAALRLVDRTPSTQAAWHVVRARLLVDLGRIEEAHKEVMAAEQDRAPRTGIASLDGRSGAGYRLLAAVGMTDAAHRQAQAALDDALGEISRGNRAPFVMVGCIDAHLFLGHRDEARTRLAEWRREALASSSPYRRSEFKALAALLYGRLGQVDEAVEIVNELMTNGYFMGLRRGPDPDFALIWSDPRFQQLAKATEDWLKSQPDPIDL